MHVVVHARMCMCAGMYVCACARACAHVCRRIWMHVSLQGRRYCQQSGTRMVRMVLLPWLRLPLRYRGYCPLISLLRVLHCAMASGIVCGGHFVSAPVGSCVRLVWFVLVLVVCW